MARSEEAILKRAMKRQRTEEEQRKADRKDMELSKSRKAREEARQQAKGKKESSRSLKGSPFLALRKTPPAPVALAATQSEASKTQPTEKTSQQPKHPSEPDERMREEGAWECPSCGNENFASRNWCNSKTCNEGRPADIARPTLFSKNKTSSTASKDYRQRHLMTEPGAWDCPSCGFQNYASRDKCFSRSCGQPRPGSSSNTTNSVSKSSANSSKRKRHDPETSKQLVWSKQADATILTKNQELRERYRTTSGEGMTQEEIDRAKILVARDQRKRQQKGASHSATEPEKCCEENTTKNPGQVDKAILVSSENTSKGEAMEQKDSKRQSKSQKDRNKILLERYKESKGQGMTEDEVERAKLLLARAERKKAKRAQAEQSKESSVDLQ